MLLCLLFPFNAHAKDISIGAMELMDIMGSYFMTVKEGDYNITTTGLQLTYNSDNNTLRIVNYSGQSVIRPYDRVKVSVGGYPMRVDESGWYYQNETEWVKLK